MNALFDRMAYQICYFFKQIRSEIASLLYSIHLCVLLTFIKRNKLLFSRRMMQETTGRWYFGRTTCDLFNANDVLFSTSSLLHLCCVSVDRYVAVIDPFNYDRKMSPRTVGWLLAGVWTVSTLVSHVPIHLGWHAVRPPGNPPTAATEATAAATGSSANATALAEPEIDQSPMNSLSVCVFEVNQVSRDGTAVAIIAKHMVQYFAFMCALLFTFLACMGLFAFVSVLVTETAKILGSLNACNVQQDALLIGCFNDNK